MAVRQPDQVRAGGEVAPALDRVPNVMRPPAGFAVEYKGLIVTVVDRREHGRRVYPGPGWCYVRIDGPDAKPWFACVKNDQFWELVRNEPDGKGGRA